jgi:hypothetical protein
VLPVLEHITAQGAAIHLHPAPPPGQQGLAPGTMTGFAFAVDTSLAVVRLIGAGLFDRDPVIVAAHLGGVLPWLRDRLAIHSQTMPLPDQPQLARPMGEYLDRLYVDTVGYGPTPLEYCYASSAPTACCSALITHTPHPASRENSLTACPAHTLNVSRSWPATRSACYGLIPC